MTKSKYLSRAERMVGSSNCFFTMFTVLVQLSRMALGCRFVRKKENPPEQRKTLTVTVKDETEKTEECVHMTLEDEYQLHHRPNMYVWNRRKSVDDRSPHDYRDAVLRNKCMHNLYGSDTSNTSCALSGS